MYTESNAEIMKEHAGEKWRPSNGTEFDIFSSEWCVDCKCRRGCSVVPLSMAYEVEDSRYPNAWVIGDDGQPICKEFMAATVSA